MASASTFASASTLAERFNGIAVKPDDIPRTSSPSSTEDVDYRNVDVSRFNNSKVSTTIPSRKNLMVRVESNSACPSLCIPSVHENITRRDIFEVFKGLELGHIDNIQIVKRNPNKPSKSKKSSQFSPVYIHFVYWFDNETASSVMKAVNEGNSFKIEYDDANPHKYWKVVKSDLPKPIPSISHEPSLKWHNRLEEDGTEEEIDYDMDSEGSKPDPEERKMSLVIPRVRKGYTTEHLRYMFEKLELFEEIERIDLSFPKRSAPLSAKAYMTAYVHTTFRNVPFANYLQDFLDETGDRQMEIVHDVMPKKWSLLVKKSDLGKPDKSKTMHSKTKISSTPTIVLGKK